MSGVSKSIKNTAKTTLCQLRLPKIGRELNLHFLLPYSTLGNFPHSYLPLKLHFPPVLNCIEFYFPSNLAPSPVMTSTLIVTTNVIFFIFDISFISIFPLIFAFCLLFFLLWTFPLHFSPSASFTSMFHSTRCSLSQFLYSFLLLPLRMSFVATLSESERLLLLKNFFFLFYPQM